MATFHPPVAPRDAPSSELRVRRALTALGDEWHVFHQVRWQGVRSGRQGDGEADFVLAHHRHGIVVLEVKGGRIAVIDGRWFATDRNDGVHEIKNPFVQATASKHALLVCLKDFATRLPRVCHAVVFPDASVDEPIGMHPKAIVIDGVRLASMATSLESILRHWGQYGASSISAPLLERIVRVLAPTTVIRRRLGVDVAEAEGELLSLTERQISLLATFRRIRRCAINGGAGTGKTLLALEKAKQLSLAGGRVLLVCFNTPLASRLRAELVPMDVTVRTFHGLCLEYCRALGRPIPTSIQEDWWRRRAPMELKAAGDACTAERLFDAIIVDEAQDFAGEWLSALESLLRGPAEGFFYLFTDPHQSLFDRDHVLPALPVLELDLNCRNTRAIAEAVAHAIGDLPMKHASVPRGRPIAFVEAGPDNVGAVVRSLVDRLLHEESIGTDQIAVLCDTRATVNQLRMLTTTGHAFVELGAVGVPTETVHRFKGLESALVVLAFVQPPPRLDDETRALLYVGASRGRTFLIVVGPARLKEWLGLTP